LRKFGAGSIRRIGDPAKKSRARSYKCPMFKSYLRALALLRSEVQPALLLVAANIGVALIGLAEPILFGRVVDALANAREAFDDIALWGGLALIGIPASVIVATFADRLAHRQRQAAMASAFERAITMPISYHAERGTGRIIRTMLAGADSLFGLWLSFFREHLAAFIGIAMLIPTAIFMNAYLAGILGILAALYAVANLVVVRRTLGGQASVERYHQSVSSRVGDVISNVTIVQSYARLGAEAMALRDLMSQLLSAQYPVLTWWAMLAVLTRAAATIAMVAIFAVGALLAGSGDITIGTIVSFVGFATLMIGRLDQISGFVSRIFVQAPILSAFYELLDSTAAPDERPGALPIGTVRGDVVFDKVSYRFADSDLGLFDVSFEARPGETVALVGPTGAGKTTALALLQRLRDPDSGRILVDGKDIRDVTVNSLRESIAVVFQDAGLFNRSIAENIRLGRSDASDAEVEAAARLAQAHDFIMAKPNGYRFVIGERGQALSGGERQRIAIARAILKNAPVLIFDEATSALDNETERRIKLALDEVRRGRTTFVIAHRLSTVIDADRILVFDKGRIVEAGRCDELIAQGGLFAKLAVGGNLSPAINAAAATAAT